VNDEPIDYLCFIYYTDERVLSDIIYNFKEYRDYPKALQDDLVKEISYKTILQMTIIKHKEMERLQKI
jgi:hypothetical protein